MVFVFGSNEAGIHGAGAALHARKFYGALQLVGVGPMPDEKAPSCYAIPTKDKKIRTLPLWNINEYVREFLEYARSRPDLKFNITRIGCGLAGYTDNDISPMFKLAPTNCNLPEGWKHED